MNLPLKLPIYFLRHAVRAGAVLFTLALLLGAAILLPCSTSAAPASVNPNVDDPSWSLMLSLAVLFFAVVIVQQATKSSRRKSGPRRATGVARLWK